MHYIQSYYTDIGIKRKTNQDSLAVLKADTSYGEVLLAMVCDGMGGHQSGELASKTIVKEFERWFKLEFPALLYNELDAVILEEQWKRLIQKCNDRLVDYGNKHEIEMGSTLTAFLFLQNKYYAAHVGDSRGYMINDERAFQITRDHSLLADEVRRGILTEEEARKDRRFNILLECVGITSTVNIDFYCGNTLPETCFLLCSDGFWHRLEESELVHYLSGQQIGDNKKMRMHLNYLVETVKQRGEKDNITAVGVIPL